MKKQKSSDAKDPRFLYETGFGKAIQGFRTLDGALNFTTRWRRLTVDDLRLLYPEETRGKGDLEVRLIQQEVFEEVRRSGVTGIFNILEGSLNFVQTVLKSVAETATAGVATGSIRKPDVMLATLQLSQRIIVDIFVFSTDSSGVPDFERFINYRCAIAFGYTLGKRIKESEDILVRTELIN